MLDPVPRLRPCDRSAIYDHSLMKSTEDGGRNCHKGKNNCLVVSEELYIY